MNVTMTPMEAIRKIASLAPTDGELPEWASIAKRIDHEYESMPNLGEVVGPNGPFEVFDHDFALAELLQAGVIFSNSREYICVDGSKQPETVVLFVLCNDLFAWACADAECLPMQEVANVYNAWKQSGSFGVERWCCMRRKQRPQHRIEREWRAEGKWDDMLESLPVKQ